MAISVDLTIGMVSARQYGSQGMAVSGLFTTLMTKVVGRLSFSSLRPDSAHLNTTFASESHRSKYTEARQRTAALSDANGDYQCRSEFVKGHALVLEIGVGNVTSTWRPSLLVNPTPLEKILCELRTCGHETFSSSSARLNSR